MTQDTHGWIIVRVANKGSKDEIILPQQLYGAGDKCRDIIEATNTTVFAEEYSADVCLQRCKLGRPNSNLEVRQAVVKLEILS